MRQSNPLKDSKILLCALGLILGFLMFLFGNPELAILFMEKVSLIVISDPSSPLE
jgi:hypothetical protein